MPTLQRLSWYLPFMCMRPRSTMSCFRCKPRVSRTYDPRCEFHDSYHFPHKKWKTDDSATNNPSQELESWSWKKLDCTGIIPPARQLLMLGVGSVLHTTWEKEITLIPKRSLGVVLQHFCVINRF